MADPQPGHATHDSELVARAASGDLAAGEAVAARNLLAACGACAGLAADLRAIAAATRTLPDAAARSARRPAPRDFRLSDVDAARLRPGGLAGLVRRISGLRHGAGPRAQGLGGALVSLGLVGLLVSAGVPALLGGSGGTAQVESGTEPAKVSASDAAAAPAATDVLAFATSDGDVMGSPDRDTTPAPTSPWATITAGSIIVAAAGLVLLAIGWRSRRSRPEGT